jgi:hypothetical protein
MQSRHGTTTLRHCAALIASATSGVVAAKSVIACKHPQSLGLWCTALLVINIKLSLTVLQEWKADIKVLPHLLLLLLSWVLAALLVLL